MAVWPESKPLNVANLSDLVNKVDQAEQNMNDGRSIIASAVAAMNQPATAKDTYNQLAQKIRDISKDATASVVDVIAGESFYQGGVKRIGTKPRRTGHVTGVSISRSGTILRIRPQAGDYAGDTNNSVQWNDPNFIAANIRKDVSLFGLVGTAPETAMDSGVTDSIPDGIMEEIEVRGLGFQPVMVSAWGSGEAMIYNGLNYYTVGLFRNASSTSFTIYPDGFRMWVYGHIPGSAYSQKWNWLALKTWG